MTSPILRRKSGAALLLRRSWVGLAALAYGLISCTLVLNRHGHLQFFMQHLAFALPLSVTGAITLFAALDLGRSEREAGLWLAVVCGGALINVLPYAIKYGGGMWNKLIPRAPIHGDDLRNGLVLPARAFNAARAGWPPLTLWLGKLFTLLDWRAAYVLQFVILLALAVTATWLSVTLAARVADCADHRTERQDMPWMFFAAMLGWLLTSYGFFYEIERGNIDLYALVFALLAILLTLRTRTAWLPSLCLAVAVNLKIYPAILAVVLLWRYRLRAVLPLVVFCGVFALSAGVGNLRGFVSKIGRMAGRNSHLGSGGNSAASFVYVLHHLRHLGHRVPGGLAPLLLLASLALWAATLAVLVRRGWSERGAVMAAAACVPVMCTVPSISNDYKLVLFVFPLAVLCLALATMKRSPGARWSALFLALAMEMVVLARSSQPLRPSIMGSKFVAIVLLQVLMLLVVLLQRDTRHSETLVPHLASDDGSLDDRHRLASRAREAARTS